MELLMISKVIRCVLVFAMLSSQIAYAQDIYNKKPAVSTGVNLDDPWQNEKTQVLGLPQQGSSGQAGTQQSSGGSGQAAAPATNLEPSQGATQPGAGGAVLPSAAGEAAATAPAVKEQVPFREIPAPQVTPPTEELSDFEKYVSGKSTAAALVRHKTVRLRSVRETFVLHAAGAEERAGRPRLCYRPRR